MNKIEKIEKLLNEWEVKAAHSTPGFRGAMFEVSSEVVNVLNLTLAILKEPSNEKLNRKQAKSDNCIYCNVKPGMKHEKGCAALTSHRGQHNIILTKRE